MKYSLRQRKAALLEWEASGRKNTQRILAKFKCHERTLWTWKARYDGTNESLKDKSSRPHTPHPNAHKPVEHATIVKFLTEHPHIGYAELYGKLRQEISYSRHYQSMYKYIAKNQLRESRVIKKFYKPKPYHTPEMLGVKWQMDVKWVPQECIAGSNKLARYMQYTVIDEATRQRFLYHYDSACGLNTVNFLKRAFVFFGYTPLVMQTDNGPEFTYHRTGKRATKKIHAVTEHLNKFGIRHKFIRPYTPRENGKVERSHRNDQQNFYSHVRVNSLDEMRVEAAKWLERSNNIPSSALNWKTPNEKRIELLAELKQITHAKQISFTRQSMNTAIREYAETAAFI
jgi:transposase InsO family protein